eukprot:15335935-Ditylum_brightwellii.AAC.1
MATLVTSHFTPSHMFHIVCEFPVSPTAMWHIENRQRTKKSKCNCCTIVVASTNQAGSDIINAKCLIVSHKNGDGNALKELIDVMKAISDKCSDKTDMKFLCDLNPNGLVPWVWAASNLPKMCNKYTMIMLDLPDQGGYY